MHLYPTGGHGFALCQQFAKFEEVCDWPKAAQRFLQGHGFAPGSGSLPPRAVDFHRGRGGAPGA